MTDRQTRIDLLQGTPDLLILPTLQWRPQHADHCRHVKAVRLFERRRPRRHRGDDLQAEIAAHLAQVTQERVAGGGDRRAASLARRDEFGLVTPASRGARLDPPAAPRHC